MPEWLVNIGGTGRAIWQRARVEWAPILRASSDFLLSQPLFLKVPENSASVGSRPCGVYLSGGATCEHPPHHQDYDRANACTNETGSFASPIPPDSLAKEGGDQGSHNSKHGRQNKP